jgi:hypothetical protein
MTATITSIDTATRKVTVTLSPETFDEQVMINKGEIIFLVENKVSPGKPIELVEKRICNCQY